MSIAVMQYSNRRNHNEHYFVTFLFFKPLILAVLNYSVVDPDPVRSETFFVGFGKKSFGIRMRAAPDSK
jgi:hypothetical protein